MNPIIVDVEHFGRVKNSRLEILPFVLFSGESGLGKSYMALLCHYFFEVLLNPFRLTQFFVAHGYDYAEKSSNYHNEGTALVVNKGDLEAWLAKDATTYVGMMLGNSSFAASVKVSLPDVIPDELKYTYTEELTGLVNEEEVYIILGLSDLTYRVKRITIEEESPFAKLMRYVLIDYIFGDYRKLKRSFVLPPSRGSIMTESIEPQTGMYAHFIHWLKRLNWKKEETSEADGNLLELFHELLDGEVKKKDNTYFYESQGMKIPISAAAASVREIAPLEFIVQNADVSTSAILFEEPEAHLHPLKQRMMADLLSLFANAGAYMQVTTHSDYLIRRLNELLMLKRVKEKMNDETAFLQFCENNKILPKLALSAERIAAYILVPNADGTSSLSRQDVTSGVPFRSFREAITQSMNTEKILEEKLDEICE